MKIFLTGGTGFIGKPLFNKLAHDHEIFLLVRDKSKINKMKNVFLSEGSMENLSKFQGDLKKFNPDICIHLAWEGIPNLDFSNSLKNLTDSSKLLKFVLEETFCKKIISTGSCFEYGKTNGICNENEKTKITTSFSWAKHSLKNFLQLTAQQTNKSWVWLRVFYAYGPGQRSTSLIPFLYSCLKKNKTLELNSPFNANDFIFVDDIVQALINSTNREIPSGIYNLGSGKPYQVLDLCKVLEKEILGSTKLSQFLEKNSKQKSQINFWANIEKTEKVLSWLPKTSLEEGIKAYISYKSS